MSCVQSTPWAWGRLGAKQSRPRRSTMPGAPTPTGGSTAWAGVPSAVSSWATTSATAAATWLPTIARVPVGVGTRASATIASPAPRATPRTLVPPMSMP